LVLTSGLKRIEEETMSERERARLEDAVERKREEARAKAEQAQLDRPERPQEAKSVRAKATRHRKKTADKWNQ
jgi:hypothetical protein